MGGGGDRNWIVLSSNTIAPPFQIVHPQGHRRHSGAGPREVATTAPARREATAAAARSGPPQGRQHRGPREAAVAAPS
jgi:hypothetical protein